MGKKHPGSATLLVTKQYHGTAVPDMGERAANRLQLELEEVGLDLEDLGDLFLLEVAVVHKVQVNHRLSAVVLVPLEGHHLQTTNN